MDFRKCVVGASLLLAMAGHGLADDAKKVKIDDVPDPDKGTAMQSWTPVQQYMPVRGRRSGRGETWGYHSPAGMLVMADELGDKLSELGRAGLIDMCFEYSKESAESTLEWALCGPDVKALDMKKLAAELDAEKISDESKNDTLEDINRYVNKAKKVGEAVEKAAKTDPGVAQVLKLADQAKAEWATFIGKNKDAFDRYLKMKDGVRSGMSNHPSFQGCWEQTQPPFAKLVKATKFPWDIDSDPLPSYMALVTTTPENYLIAAAFSACAFSVDPAGEALAAAVFNDLNGGDLKVGWRSLATAKALDPKFKPKFADRSLNWSEYGMLGSLQHSKINMSTLNGTAAIMTPTMGTIKAVKKNGDTATLSFKPDTANVCLQWVETNKIDHYGANGDPQYQRVCKKRGNVPNETSNVDVPTKFTGTLAPGVSVRVVHGIPVDAWKGNKFVSVFSFPTK